MTNTRENAEDLPLDRRDQTVAARSLEHAGSAIRLIDEGLLLLNHGTAALTGHKHDRGLNFLTALLIVRAFNSIWKAREAAVEGYSVQCFVLARAALEDWIAIRWVEERPDEKDLWLSRLFSEVRVPLDSKGRERWVPSVDEMLKDIPEGALPRVAYGHVSKFAHPRGTGLRWQFHADEESSFIHCGPHFDEQDLQACLYFLAHTVAGLLPAAERVQIRAFGQADPEWVERGTALVEQYLQYIRDVGASVLEEGDE